MVKEGFVKRIGGLLNAFSGGGVEGKKSLEELKAEAETLLAEAKTGEEKKALAELDAAIKKAEEEAAGTVRPEPVEGLTETMKEKRERLKRLKAENDRLTKDEDAKGLMDGGLAILRMARRRDIEGLEAEVQDA